MKAECTWASHKKNQNFKGYVYSIEKFGVMVSELMPMKMDNQLAMKQLESEGSMMNGKHVDAQVNCLRLR